jgi:hypothetical protein
MNFKHEFMYFIPAKQESKKMSRNLRSHAILESARPGTVQEAPSEGEGGNSTIAFVGHHRN